MQIELESQPDAIARWQELSEDPELARWPGRIETDRFGRIIMSPPPGLPHSFNQSKILQLPAQLLPDGQALTECPLVTLDGIKGIDVAWLKGGSQAQEKPRGRNLRGGRRVQGPSYADRRRLDGTTISLVVESGK